MLFRSASVPLMLAAETAVTKTIFLSPVIFGLAHLHHFYEFRVTHPGVPASTGLLRSLLQFTYTSLFGAYATFLHLRTGSLLALFAVLSQESPTAGYDEKHQAPHDVRRDQG